MSSGYDVQYYLVKVTVDNAVGTAESDSVVFLLSDVPAQPSAPTRISDGKQLTIVMDAPTQDGGAQVTNYQL